MSTDSLSCQDIDFPISHESPEDQLIVLSRCQLAELIRCAVHQALQDAQQGQETVLEVVQDLQAENSALKRELEDLSSWVEDLQENQNGFASLMGKHICLDPQPKQKDRGEILRALLVARGGNMLLKDARNIMGLKPATFSVLLSTLKDEIEVTRSRSNKRLMVLRLK